MIRAQPDPSPITETISRVRAWLASAERGSRAQIAETAGIDEKTLRLAANPKWNPTADTLRKLERAIPADWQPAKRRKVA